MNSVLTALAYAIPIGAVLISIAIGFREVRALRKETGDQSRLTAFLGGDFRAFRHCDDV